LNALVDRLGSEHPPDVIARCVALLFVLVATALTPLSEPTWGTQGAQLCAGQLEQSRRAFLGQIDIEPQEGDVEPSAPPRMATWRPTVAWLPMRLSPPRRPLTQPFIVRPAVLHDQRRSIRRLKTHAHVPRMEADPSCA
jgi:hypothetical protein